MCFNLYSGDIGYLKDRLLQIYIGTDDCFDIADKVWGEKDGHDIILNCEKIVDFNKNM